MPLPARLRQGFSEQPLLAGANCRRQEAHRPNLSVAPALAVGWWTQGLEEVMGLATDSEKATERGSERGKAMVPEHRLLRPRVLSSVWDGPRTERRRCRALRK